MFKKKFSTLSRFATPHKQGGQVSILFALLMPIFILFLGVALDLGWYYLNVSRLQNAADAAAVAGAQAIVDSENFSDYKNIALIGKYPAKVSNQYRANSVYESTTIENGKLIAEKYVGKNLSGNENTLVNSWTNNKVQTDASTLYTSNDKLYFVVKLKDTIQHFFLPGWFSDMDAPVTAVAIMSKTAITADDKAGETSTPEMPASPFSSDTASNSDLPTMPSMPTDPRVISQEFQYALEDDRNKNVIIGNWQVQSKYKNDNTMVTVERDGKFVQVTQYEAIFGSKVYSERWNHFQDLYNHYVAGKFYRTGTVNVFDDVFDDNGDGKADRYGKTGNNGKTSDVVATSASSNAGGLPYLGSVLDSINIDFKPEVDLSDTDWLKEDWDLALGDVSANKFNYKNAWSTSNGVKYDDIKRLRIHMSINFDKPYTARDNENRQEENKGNKPDILWTRIESEPILHYPDVISGNSKDAEGKSRIKSTENKGLNSINQIIINANKSNTGENDRPIVIFYDGPETNDVYGDYKTKTDVLHRKSLPVILNLNVPFNAILYAPNSPVVVIGDNKDYFQGFVVAKEYVRLKDDRDFVLGSTYTNRDELSLYNLPTYYAKDDKSTEPTPYYKVTDENGIEMFVDRYGDIQFAELPTAPARYGTYNTFGRTKLTTHNYDIEQYSMNNMLLSGK